MIKIERGHDYSPGTWKPGTSKEGESVAFVTCPQCHSSEHRAVHILGLVPEDGKTFLECTCGLEEDVQLVDWAERPRRRS